MVAWCFTDASLWQFLIMQIARQVFWAIGWSIGLVGKDSFVVPGPAVAWGGSLLNDVLEIFDSYIEHCMKMLKV